eukprot:GHVP01054271.1.p1 GENE.GHVP01054271.1~~GHVP01054271.1.p1  ORF type:complete len:417 (-),score=72.15 GHVP01054271.1:35-1285(-)
MTTNLFSSLGVCKELCAACSNLGWNHPTLIQEQAIPAGLKKRDLVALASTGSGKTGAFAIPILQHLLKDPKVMRVLVMTPTRELAIQIRDQFTALGEKIFLKVVALVGGIEMQAQAGAIKNKPHVIVGTPGRIKDHLQNTKNFSLKNVKFVVLDEADRLLADEFDDGVKYILDNVPKERQNYLFSATMTADVTKLEKACLTDPVKISTDSRRSIPTTLSEEVALVPEKFKLSFLLTLLQRSVGRSSALIFCNMRDSVSEAAQVLDQCSIPCATLTGKMGQEERLDALNSFKSGFPKVLVATDVGSRGLDIPVVDWVINLDVPLKKNEYTHRVGRTARAGKSGKALTIVSQYEAVLFVQLETYLQRKVPIFDALLEQDYLENHKQVEEARQIAREKIRESNKRKQRKGSGPRKKYKK